MKIHIKTLDALTVQLEVKPSSTIAEVKNKITQQENIDYACQRLFFTGKELKDDKTLDFYGINETSTLNLLLRLYVFKN